MPEETDTPVLDEFHPPAEAAQSDPPPKPRKQPQDHKKPAAQLEAEADETVTVEWEGETFVMPASPDDWTVEATLAIENRLAQSFLLETLGPIRHARMVADWREKHGRKMRNKDAGPLVNAYFTAIGIEGLGE